MANTNDILDRLEPTPDRPSGRSGAGKPAAARRVAGRSPLLPGYRAILGALLCTSAALLTFAAYARANRPPTAKYLIATRTIEPGAALTAADAEAVALDLPDAVSRRVVGPSVSLDGAVVLGPVGKGELFQVGNLIRKTGGSGSRELSFPIDSAFAAGGRLRPGDRIDVYASRGAEAAPVAADLLVIATSSPADGASSGRGTLVITVAYDGTYNGAELLGAAQSTRLSLIRRTGVRGDITQTVAVTPPSQRTAPAPAADGTGGEP